MFLDPDFVLEQIAKAPREFDLVARNPEHFVRVGGDDIVFLGRVRAAVRARRRRSPRRPRMADFERFVVLLASVRSTRLRQQRSNPNDTPLDSRHLDMVFALQTLSDKFHMGSVTSGPNAADTIAMSEILFGSREAIERAPVTISLINMNRPSASTIACSRPCSSTTAPTRR